jgi:hypothetical protein
MRELRGVLLAVLTACGAEASVEGASGQAPPPGMLGCGPDFCGIADEYCMIYVSDQGDANQYRCAPFPSGCASNRHCDCLIDGRLGLTCEGDAESGLTLTSLGG